MRLTIKRKVLQEALDVCGPVAGARVAGVRLICRCVLLAADKDGGVEVQATDMAQGVRVKIEAEAVKEPEAWALPAQVLRNVVTALPADVEVVAFDGSVTPAKSDKEVSTCKATLRAGRDCFEFLGYGPEQFPDVAGLDAGAGPALSVPAGELGAMVERVGFAACTEGRYALKGVLFEFEKNTLTLVATDGRRLALTKAKVKAGKDAPAWSNKDNTAFVYPLEALRSLRDLCARGGEGGAVELALCGWTILARGERITLSALGVEGLFPKYWVAIPKDHEREAVFNRAALIEAVQRVQGFADPDLAGYSGWCCCFRRAPASPGPRVLTTGAARCRWPLSTAGRNAGWIASRGCYLRP